jgi:uncharacterized membrane protein
MGRNHKNKPPAPVRQNTQSVVTGQSVSYSEMHVGPFPPARDLVLLEENIPGAFDRLMAFAEREQENQAKFTESLIKGNTFFMKISLLVCFAVVIVYLSLLFYLAWLRLEHALQYAIMTGLVAGIPAVIYSLRGIVRKQTGNGQHP